MPDSAVDSSNHELAPVLPTLPEGRSVISTLEAGRKALAAARVYSLVGADGCAPALLADAVIRAGAARAVYVAPDAEAAERAAADLNAFSRGLPLARFAPLPEAPQALLLVAPEAGPYAEVHPDRRAGMLRAATLYQLASSTAWRYLVLSPAALARKVPPPSVLTEAAVRLVAEQEIDVVQVSRQLTASGYLRVPVVEDPGTYALRGGILDVWPSQLDLPLRAELYGDLVLTLRAFDPDDQRTLREVSAADLPPVREAIIGERSEARARELLRSLCDAIDHPTTKARQLIDDLATGRAFFGSDGYLPAFYPLVSLFEYLPRGTPIVIEEPARFLAELRGELERAQHGELSRRGTPHFAVDALYASAEELEAGLAGRPLVAAHRAGIAGAASSQLLDGLERTPLDAESLAISAHADLTRAVRAARSADGKDSALEPLLERIRVWHDASLSVVLSARTDTQAERLAALLGHRGIAVRVTTADEHGKAADRDSVRIVTAPLARGALSLAEGFVLVTEEEIFGPRAHRPAARKRSARALLEDLRALEPGDFVVHVDHGVGKYLGLERKPVGAVHVDLLVVEYAGGDKLFLPIYRLNQIEKYAGAEGVPKLDRLGGQTFAKTKARVQRRVRQMADELLKLYAERAAQKKTPLAAPGDDYAAFEASFPFEETRDQAAAIADVMRDIQNERVMDRLVCGDVGFGKTEVALRAAFYNAASGRQVALLCPTTVLAQQHFNTLAARLQGYPLNVHALSRFQSKTEQAETLKGLKEGGVDVVVGTHRLLSKDVHFKNLGLLVVDEEQRFGVVHKERIKQLRTSVDVLTLSATPIPRTLQLAVGGLRDMSIITTAPVDRRAIRTVVSQFDADLVREAVERELARGGQVFYVYNRVEGIYERAQRLNELVPNARVAVGHGQLSEHALERTMLAFVNGDYDVLVATAIIESGLDIPRANTIIIDRADLFGLSQLYQLRGRVGRSNERAYAFLLVPPPSQLTEQARARIEALERHTELGSGFHIATLDMELRGAGELLGAEQSGFVESVGFELFCKLLEEATHELKGEVVVHEVEPELSFDVEALLSEDYIAEVGVRLSLYKRLASAADEAEVSELSAEMENRFGPPPLEARRLVELMRLKTELRKLNVLGCEASGKSVTLHLRGDTPLDPQKIGALLGQKKSLYRLSPDGRLTRRAGEQEAIADGLVLADRMLSELAHARLPG